ncbi:MAG TPA: hypothetical protein VNS19_11655 [Acidimicrobiales bacterium]|jgi:hypothetical protein|nr:hypothetical protein [Acidimicrobiales bacterium]
MLAGTALGLVALLGPAVAASAAAPPQPTYASANVDGNPWEWNNFDTWGTLLSNDPPYRIVGKVLLRYDCKTQVLYAYAKVSPGEIMQTADPAEAYLRLGQTGKLVSGQSGDDGTAPDFRWVGESNGTAKGFEASAKVAPGSYPASFRVHAKLPDDSADGYETIDLDPRYSDLTIECKQHTCGGGGSWNWGGFKPKY